MNSIRDTLSFLLPLWANHIVPLLVPWSLAAVLFIFLAERLHRLTQTNDLSLQNRLWRAAIVSFFCLPFLQACHISFISIPLSSRYYQLFAGSWFRITVYVAGIVYIMGLWIPLSRLILNGKDIFLLLRAAVPCRTPNIHFLLHEEATRLGIKGKIHIRIVDIDCSPAVVYTLKTYIVLPRFLLHQYSPSDIRLVLIHELTHIRNNDRLFWILLWSMETLLWFVPGIHVLRYRFNEAAETQCDNEAVKASSAKKEYAALFYRLSQSLYQSAYAEGMAHFSQKNAALRRFQRILSLEEGALESTSMAHRFLTIPCFVLLLFLLGGLQITATPNKLRSESADIPTVVLNNIVLTQTFPETAMPDPAAICPIDAPKVGNVIYAGGAYWYLNTESNGIAEIVGWSFDKINTQFKQAGKLTLPYHPIVSNQPIDYNAVSYALLYGGGDYLIVTGIDSNNLVTLKTNISKANSYGGIVIVDVSNPLNPKIAAHIGGVLAQVAANQDHLLLALLSTIKEDDWGYCRSNEIVAFDIKNIYAPQELWRTPSPDNKEGIYAADFSPRDPSILYIGVNSDLFLYKIDQKEFRLLSCWKFGDATSFINFIKAYNDYLFLVTSSLQGIPFQNTMANVCLRSIPLIKPDEASLLYKLPIVNPNSTSITFYGCTYENSRQMLTYILGSAEGIYLSQVNHEGRIQPLACYPLKNYQFPLLWMEEFIAIGINPIYLYPAASFHFDADVLNWDAYGHNAPR
ncbi:MAG: M56 family metallopeptidase [Candidatus Omnitrophota bacterium]